MRLRPAQSNDLEALMALATQAKAGLTTLPPDREILGERLAKSQMSFEYRPHAPGDQNYLFVLENEQNNTILGTCGIAAKIGGYQPHWTYELKYQTFKSESLKTEKEVPYLQIKTNHNGPSEIGTLFLAPEARGGPWGRFLSLVRFSFIAAYPECFEHEVIAEMRGRIDDQHRSVFWEALGRHFFEMDFQQADRLSMRNKHIIAELMPTHPIYVPLLPKQAQTVIGKVHPDTEPALRLLQQEGFQFTGEVDIFEAGPVMSCKCTQLRSVREAKIKTIVTIFDDTEQVKDTIIANPNDFKNFCSSLGKVVELEHGVAVSKSTLTQLNLEIGSNLLYLPLRPKD